MKMTSRVIGGVRSLLGRQGKLSRSHARFARSDVPDREALEKLRACEMAVEA
ncbi:MAG: hypothetical protein ABI889_02130 [Gemmatimonadota bacterium]